MQFTILHGPKWQTIELTCPESLLDRFKAVFLDTCQKIPLHYWQGIARKWEGKVTVSAESRLTDTGDTACGVCETDGGLWFSAECIGRLTDSELAYLIAHEVSHLYQQLRSPLAPNTEKSANQRLGIWGFTREGWKGYRPKTAFESYRDTY